MRRAAGAVALALLPVLALAQDGADPLAPPPPSEEALRRETGTLLVRLAARKTTPVAEDLLLSLLIETAGRPFDQERLVEVAVRRGEQGEDVRVRFRAPAALRDEAHLRLADGRAWSYDPARRRAERAKPLAPTWRVGGGGLLLADLLREDLDTHGYTHERDDALEDDGRSVPVHVVRAVAREGDAARRLWIDRERHVVVMVEHLDAEGRVERLVRAREWSWVQGLLRPSLLVVTEPGLERVTTVRVRGRRSADLPDARFDPARFAS